MNSLRLVTMIPLASTMLLSSCVVAPYGPGCAFHQPCGNPGGGYGYGGYAPPAQGTVGGALLGAAAGGIIGHQSGRGLEGAALGGVLGALAGRVMETSRQDTYYQPAYYNPPQPVYEPDYDHGYGYNDPYAY